LNAEHRSLPAHACDGLNLLLWLTAYRNKGASSLSSLLHRENVPETKHDHLWWVKMSMPFTAMDILTSTFVFLAICEYHLVDYDVFSVF
jgi:hypothetical protein